jgi:hypothetical protein
MTFWVRRVALQGLHLRSRPKYTLTTLQYTHHGVAILCHQRRSQLYVGLEHH